MKKTIAKLILPLLLAVALPAGAARTVMLITIDGFRGTMVDDPQMPTPFLKMMSAGGMRVDKIIGVPPAATYPSHTTLVTGVVPAKHHIYYNRPFLRNQDVPQVSYWWADTIGAPTIWQQAKERGLTTCALFWPVSTGSRYIDYNVPEFWSLDYRVDQLAYIKPWCTPAGILDTLERHACGDLNGITYMAGSLQRDGRTAAMANYILNRYRPNLFTIHLITTDYAQHATGLMSQRVLEAVASADHAVGTIIENLRRTRQLDSTVLIVTGDHGFCDYHRILAPNVWLTQAGLLSEKLGGEWQACFVGAGSTSFLYLNGKHQAKTLKRVKALLSQLPDSVQAMYRLYDKAQLDSMGADPQVALALEPAHDVTVSNARTGAAITYRHGGTHGYLDHRDATTMIVWGAGIKPGKQAQMQQTAIAPMILELLDK